MERYSAKTHLIFRRHGFNHKVSEILSLLDVQLLQKDIKKSFYFCFISDCLHHEKALRYLKIYALTEDSFLMHFRGQLFDRSE